MTKNISLVDYSPKAFAVFGDTKPFKEALGYNGLKGKFNRGLNYNGVKTPGWIFSKKRLAAVENYFGVKLVSVPGVCKLEAVTGGYEPSEQDIEQGFFNREAGYEAA